MLAAIGLLALIGCSDEPENGPGEVRWDRETCARCAMALSDHRFAAQVRSFADGRNQLYKFDDIGCAMLWLADKPWKDDPKTEVWVADVENSTWLDARTAHYVTGRTSPMGYGLGAQPQATPGSLDYAAAIQHVKDVEERINAPRGGDPHQHPAGEAH